MSADHPAVEIRGLSKTFPGTRALVDVDLDVRPGEVHALVGQNGSGKSTLIKVLAGFHRPDDGATAFVRGESYELGDSEAAHAAGLRFVHQDLGLVPTLDAVDNLALGFGYEIGRASRIRWRRQVARARASIEALGYHVNVRTPVERLEPIERTAVAIARALQGLDGHVALLVLDEPTATMPKPDAERLFEIVERVRRRGVGVLYVSHHLEEVFGLAQRVTVLRDGRAVATRPVAGLDKRQLVELMTGGFVDAQPADASQTAGEEEVLRVSGLGARELDGVELTVHAGEVVGVAGITGSGREELCPALFGGRPRTGEVTVGGRPLEAMRPDQAVALGVGLVPADRHRDGLALAMSVRENLTLTDLQRFWRRFRLHQRKERTDAAASIMQLAIRAPSAEAPVESLSGGNQQKVVLGKWLRVRPRVLLLDEPTQGVDIAATAEVHQLVDEAARQGAAVLVCSSDEDELERLSDRVVVLRSGRIVAEFRRPSITAQRLAQECLGLEPA
jgi:ribose transport system ATP-binding protein